MIKGKRAVKQDATNSWSKGDAVMFEYKGKVIRCSFRGYFEGKCKVRDRSGTIYKVPELILTADTTAVDDEDVEEPDDRAEYAVNWDLERVNFSFKVNGVKFNGWWRKRGPLSYAVDIYGQTPDGYDISVDGLSYRHDPRENMKGLNADICATINRWFHIHDFDGAKTIDNLVRRANEPVVRITRLETIDRFILKLKEYRDTAIRCGGVRYIFLEGDNPDDPKLGLKICVTPQAIALDGKVPSLYHGSVYDGISGKKGVRGQKVEIKANPQNVAELIEHLKAAKARGDVSECRKIRAAMRRMGASGGEKALDKTKGESDEKA